MNKNDLLIEIGTEELPPKTLKKLAHAFAHGMSEGLKKHDLHFDSYQGYASPRRLAVIVNALSNAQADKKELKRGPALTAAYDAEGTPTQAAHGFARSCATELTELEVLTTEKGQWLSYTMSIKGKTVTELLPSIIEQCLKTLPIAKRMRWGQTEVQFVRPVHWSVVLFGHETLKLKILGTESSHLSYGHRFHKPAAIPITHPSEYVSCLKEKGMVLVDYEERQNRIRSELKKIATSLGGTLKDNQSLLDEVTSITEWPVAITGNFAERFLALPDEILMCSMQSHQKYFPVFNEAGKLLPHFITFANIESQNPAAIRHGNERVLFPRLSDAEFFWNKDQEHKLEDYAAQLNSVVFQKQLGTLADKVNRMHDNATFIAEQLDANVAFVQRATQLAKCDLMTRMVDEFPELQGVIGHYYAKNNNEAVEVAQAIEEQYQPRFSGDTVPTTVTGQILSLADKLDTLCGLFSIGQIPRGDKDPLGLRRAALGLVRLLIECQIKLDLKALVRHCLLSFASAKTETAEKLHGFILERLRSYYLEKQIAPGVINAVLAVQTNDLLDISKRIEAVIAFAQLEEAGALAASNKRITNILKKTEMTTAIYEKEKLQEHAEKKLAERIEHIQDIMASHMQAKAYDSVLCSLASLRDDIDAFFDSVMVNCDDESIKNNRLALLAAVLGMFQHVADISQL